MLDKTSILKEIYLKKNILKKILYTKKKLHLYTGKYLCIVMELAFSTVYFCF